MDDLLATTIKAHGGQDRWNQLNTVSARLTQGGALWALKGQEGVLDRVVVTANLYDERVSHRPFGLLTGAVRSPLDALRSRPAAGLVRRAHRRNAVERITVGLLRGRGDVDLPDAAVFIHAARIPHD
jgi:hypothetical protein